MPRGRAVYISRSSKSGIRCAPPPFRQTRAPWEPGNRESQTPRQSWKNLTSPCGPMGASAAFSCPPVCCRTSVPMDLICSVVVPSHGRTRSSTLLLVLLAVHRQSKWTRAAADSLLEVELHHTRSTTADWARPQVSVCPSIHLILLEPSRSMLRLRCRRNRPSHRVHCPPFPTTLLSTSAGPHHENPP